MSISYENLIQTALTAGATKAVVIDVDRIVLSASFLDACKSNSCGNYGKCWICPPDVGPIEEWMEKIRSFPRALFWQTIDDIEDSFDIEGMGEVSRHHIVTAQKLRRLLADTLPAGMRTLHFACGGCSLCERCAKRDNEPCRHPDLAMPSLEGSGVDVYKTTSGTGMKYVNGVNTVTYFGMALFDDTEEN